MSHVAPTAEEAAHGGARFYDRVVAGTGDAIDASDDDESLDLLLSENGDRVHDDLLLSRVARGNPRVDAILKETIRCRRNVARISREAGTMIERVADLRRVRTRRSSRLATSEIAAADCVACLTRLPIVTMLPCRHRCLCFDCYVEIQHFCPLCRATVSTIRIWD